ncbi:hypothetical protein D3C75_992580 [compost metagenome]
MILLASFKPHRPIVDQDVDDLVLGLQLRHGPRHAGGVAEVQFDELRLQSGPLKDGRSHALERLAPATAKDWPAPHLGQTDGQGRAQPPAGSRDNDDGAFEFLQGDHGGNRRL